MKIIPVEKWEETIISHFFLLNKKQHTYWCTVFLAESKGFERLRLSHSLRSLNRLCSASPTGFESHCYFFKIKNSTPIGVLLLFGGEQGIRTLETVLAVYTISNRAPSTDSDNSPYIFASPFFKVPCYYNQLI